ncbi:MAG: DUF2239 family protein [Undibacterium sp.]
MNHDRARDFFGDEGQHRLIRGTGRARIGRYRQNNQSDGQHVRLRGDPSADFHPRRRLRQVLPERLLVELPGYEEAVRALFAGDEVGLERAVAGWPEGVREATLSIKPAL